jgi:two-component system response regulator HydG
MFHNEMPVFQCEVFTMKADDLKLDELIEFSEGELSLHGRRLVLHDMHAVAQLRKDLVRMAGPENARRILTRFGCFWGEADAAAMKRIFDWDSVQEWLKAGSRMHAIEGVARTSIKSMELDEQTGRFEMSIVWHDSGEAREHVAEFGTASEPVCWILNGYASGYASYCLGTKVYFIEQKCSAAGDRVCMTVGKDQASWGAEIERHLPYFETEDIRGKILKLTKELQEKTREVRRQRRQIEHLEGMAYGPMVEVRSESFRRVIELASRIAPHGSSVLITGESGVGKEVLARYIHRLSDRAGGPFVAVNCGALPDTLLESELFGHKAGAFTGAVRDHAGLFAEANKGTIFLDEIGDISHAMQVKLLRVLQTKEIRRVGDSKSRKVDARVIAATNRDLAEAVRVGKFREDLLYRLRVIEICVPPLRERPEDIVPLARHFVEQCGRKMKRPKLHLDATCLDYLQVYPWPGNVRELENAIERGAVLCDDNVIRPEHLPAGIVHAGVVRTRVPGSPERSLAQVEEDHIRAVLESSGGNKARAAAILGISPTTLWRKLKQANSSETNGRP